MLEPELFVQVPELVIPVPEIDSVPAFEMTQLVLFVTVVPVPVVVSVVPAFVASLPRLRTVIVPTEVSVTDEDTVVSTVAVLLLLSMMSSPFPAPSAESSRYTVPAEARPPGPLAPYAV
jgi:hypothetical protein